MRKGTPPYAGYAGWIAHTGLRRAVPGFLDEERESVRAEIADLAAASPFRDDGR